ncbi:TorF family putative porin, partial [Variovorax sp. GT1P44]
VGVSYDFGSGLALGGWIQGGNNQSAFNLVASPGIPTGTALGTVGGSTFSPNVTRFILTLTKTL